MDAKSKARSYFDRISEGHRFAVKRPYNLSVDRQLRKMIETANSNGDCIIPRMNGGGYYRPIPSDPVDTLEYNCYIKQEKAKVKTMELKIMSMQVAYEGRGVANEL